MVGGRPAYLYVFFIGEGGEEEDFTRFVALLRYVGVLNKKSPMHIRWSDDMDDDDVVFFQSAKT